LSYRLACSGPVSPSTRIIMRIDDALDMVEERFGKPKLLVSGAAHGVDTEWIYRASDRWAGTKVMLCVPAAPYNDTIYNKLVHAGIPIHVKTAPQGYNRSVTYMKRNDLIQKSADVLVAHPESEFEQIYSGTWSTIRRFRKAQKPVLLSPDLDGVGAVWER